MTRPPPPTPTATPARDLIAECPPAPRWVYVFGVMALVLVVLVAILHLTGNGFGRHMHQP